MPEKPKSNEVHVRDKSGKIRKLSRGDISPALAAELGFETPLAMLEANSHLLTLLGRITRPAPIADTEAGPERPRPEDDLTPEEIERALALLLRAIARAVRPQPAMVPPPENDGRDAPREDGRIADGRPSIEMTHSEGCNCACPDGITVDFIIEWDNVGPNTTLFSDQLKRGQTEDAPGESGGSQEEVEGSTDLAMNLGNPALGILNTADLEIVFNAKPFFAKGFDDDACCLAARGNFTGKIRVDSFTNRGKPGQTRVRGRMNVNKTISQGACEGEACCTVTYRWDYNQSFNINALTYDVDVDVTGVVSVTIAVHDIP
jgi:hypothetical protein